MAWIPMLISIVFTIILFAVSNKDKYKELAGEVDKKEYPLADLLVIGFYLEEKLGNEKFTKMNEAVYRKMITIYGIEVNEYYQVYIANKLLYSILILNGLLFIQGGSGNSSILMTIASIILSIILYFAIDLSIDKKIEQRSFEIKYDFPEFLTKLVLLIDAGLTFENAWGKIVNDDTSNSPLYKEMKKVINNINAGVPREVALRNMARNCRVNSITKFVAIVLQNINKGSNDMTIMLTNLSNECWRERKSLAKKKGEEASSKLLFPMIIILVAIFLVVLVPGFMQMMSM